MTAAIFNALKYLPASIAQKALVKVDPKFGKYFAKSLAYGIDANRALDYLSDRFQSSSQKNYQQRLDQRESQGLLRPDEKVSKGQLEREAIPGKVAKTLAAFGTGGLIGGLGEGQQAEPALSSEDQRQAALGQFNERLRKKKPQSELSREALMQQFQEGQQQGQGQPGKAALLSSMQQITEALRQLRENG